MFEITLKTGKVVRATSETTFYLALCENSEKISKIVKVN